MIEREILIANTKTQKRSKVTTDATTLGELKAALDNAGVDYSGMTFTEGISKTQLLDDATQLPQNVMFKGQPTNNLVILLTNTKKNIASGAGSRAEAYQMVKEHDLQEDIKEEFGTNYTHVSTNDLWSFIEEHVTFPSEDMVEAKEEEPVDELEEEKNNNEEPEQFNSHAEVIGKSIFDHIGYLVNAGIFEYTDIKHLANALNLMADEIKEEDDIPSEPVSTSDGSISNDDVTDMINDMI